VRQTELSCGIFVRVNPSFGAVDSYGVRNILTSAWELTKLSWVADWFVDIGTRLAAIESQFLTDKVGGWISYRHELLDYVLYQARFQSSFTPSYEWTGHMTEVCTKHDYSTVVERTANPDVSYLPQINVKLNWKKVADAAALARVLAPRVGRL
jgi:hypothetical protein